MKNVTLSADEDLIRKARDVARRQGSTLNQLFRDFLKGLVGPNSQEEATQELLRLMRESPGDSKGEPYRREDAYRGRRFEG